MAAATSCAAGAVPNAPELLGETDADFGTGSTSAALPSMPADDGSGEGDGSTGRDDSPPAEGGDTGPPPCPVGSLGCACTMGGACDAGLSCVDDECAVALPECGNALVEDGETCDDGEGNGDENACKSDCTLQECGDGFVGPGEACDDGNRVDTDACSNACALASCGDGVTQEGEECDDLNAIETDACLSTCLAASCGDNIVWETVEECDDGNPNETDECTNVCTIAVCGDGVRWAGVETCDDSNVFPSDGCTELCQCAWDFEDPAHVSGWTMTGGWALYTEAPLSSSPAVPFTTQGTVFGTDGNRVAPYPGSQAETSTLTTDDFLLSESLEFLSWHVDEGGTTYDRKQIAVSVDSGATWTTVLDCNAGPAQTAPFCTAAFGPRAEDAWDPVSVDVSAFAGQVGRVRFTYDTVDTCCSFEQGWFIDIANLLTCPT